MQKINAAFKLPMFSLGITFDDRTKENIISLVRFLESKRVVFPSQEWAAYFEGVRLSLEEMRKKINETSEKVKSDSKVTLCLCMATGCPCQSG